MMEFTLDLWMVPLIFFGSIEAWLVLGYILCDGYRDAYGDTYAPLLIACIIFGILFGILWICLLGFETVEEPAGCACGCCGASA